MSLYDKKCGKCGKKSKSFFMHHCTDCKKYYCDDCVFMIEGDDLYGFSVKYHVKCNVCGNMLNSTTRDWKDDD